MPQASSATSTQQDGAALSDDPSHGLYAAAGVCSLPTQVHFALLAAPTTFNVTAGLDDPARRPGPLPPMVRVFTTAWERPYRSGTC